LKDSAEKDSTSSKGILDRFGKWTGSLSNGFAWVALIAVIFMVLFSTIDLLAHKIAPTVWTFGGAMEITGILGLVMVIFAIPLTQLMNMHTAVDFLTNYLSKRVNRILAIIISFLSAGLFAVGAWQMFKYGQVTQAGGNATPLVHIPQAPFAYAGAVCFFLECLVLLVTMANLVKRGTEK